MEMHQIRYFLGVARTLNFTRAAEECHVAQPSLTRAIKLLEEELGGDLFRRERNRSHLTELGQRMLPLLQQCYDTAQGAKSLATSYKKGEVATLRLALSRTIDMKLLIPALSQLMRAINGLELKFLRGTAKEVSEYMKNGAAELAIAGPMAESWERFDVRPLFSEKFVLLVNAQHRLAGAASAKLDELWQERLIMRKYCELAEPLAASLRRDGTGNLNGHEIESERDLISLLEGNMGVAIVPSTTSIPDTLRRIPIPGLEVTRTVYLYSVAGRARATPADILMKQLLAADWKAMLG